MSNALAPEREFRVYRRGEARDEILRSYRVSLRQIVNPDTGVAFSEDEIATATARLSQPWNRAEAVDLIVLSMQNNALLMADQARTDRAATSWLDGYHGRMWGEDRLGAEGGSGTATQSATAGTIFVGSTTVPDPIAYVCTAPDGTRYQLLFTVVTPAGGTASLTFKGIDTGPDTNLIASTVLKPSSNKPPGATGNATVTALFSGGIASETDADYAKRIDDRIKHKPACGNEAHMRSWARDSSAAVEDAFVYSCALHAGTVLMCVTQKRAGAAGPLARIPSAGTLASVIAYLTPPASPVLPARPLVLVVPPQGISGHAASDLVLQLSMVTGSSGGWVDPTPWPETAINAPATVTGVMTPTTFQMTRPAGSADLPTGITNPSLMSWDASTSRFEALNVQSVTQTGPDLFDVVLSSAPTVVTAMGMYISPENGRLDAIAEAIEAYFDSLGPGEAVATLDTRFHRAARFPSMNEEWPQRAGDGVSTYLFDSLGSSLADAASLAVSNPLPAVPANPVDGPNMCVLGRVGVYPL